MRRKETGLTLSAVLVIAAAAGFASGGKRTSQANTPNGLGKQRGCRDGGFQDVNRTNPSWVSVDPSDRARPIEGTVRVSKVTSEDYPANHESHDWNFFVKPDAQYEFLNGDANLKFDNQGEKSRKSFDRCIEMEWETKQFDMRFWPVVGDRVWGMGRWIFDCGHPEEGYHTEIHPPKAVAITRLEPYIFAGDSAPSYTTKTFAYINGNGGYFYDRVGGQSYTFDITVPSRPTGSRGLLDRIKHIVKPKPNPGQPSQPAPTAQTAPPVAAPIGTTAGPAELRAQVLSLPFGGPTPTLTPLPDQNKVRVTYDLTGVNDPQRWNLYQHPLNARPRVTPKFGAIIAAGWREPVLTKAYRVLRVTFDDIKIIEDHDGTGRGSGEWKFWVHVNGTWMEITSLNDADEGKTYRIGRSITVTVPEDGSLALQTTGWESDDIDKHFRMAAAGSLPIGLGSRGIGDFFEKVGEKIKDGAEKVGETVKDTAGKIGSIPGKIKDKIIESINNDAIGAVSARYTAANNFGVGSLRDDASSTGDFRLRYRIQEVQRIPAGTANGAAAAPR